MNEYIHSKIFEYIWITKYSLHTGTNIKSWAHWACQSNLWFPLQLSHVFDFLRIMCGITLISLSSMRCASQNKILLQLGKLIKIFINFWEHLHTKSSIIQTTIVFLPKWVNWYILSRKSCRKLHGDLNKLKSLPLLWEAMTVSEKKIVYFPPPFFLLFSFFVCP